MSARAPSMCSALVVLSTTSACVADFATINLIVHESENGENRRVDDNALQVSYLLEEQRDGAPPPQVVTFNYQANSDTNSPAQELGAYAQRMTITLAVAPVLGASLDELLALGRVDPFIIPSLDEGPVTRDARAFMAAPDLVERLNVDFPGGGLQAVCDNRAGFVRAVSNEAAYAFDEEDLELTDNSKPFVTEVEANAIACDVTDEVDEAGQPTDGKLVVAYGSCGEGNPTHKIILDIGAPVLDVDFELCDPFVRHVELDPETEDDDIVWVAGASFALLIRVKEGRDVDSVELPGLDSPVRHVLLDDGTLIVQGAGENQTVAVRRAGSNDALQTPQEVSGLSRMLAGDPSGPAALFLEDGGFVLRVATVGSDGAAGEAFSRPVSLDFDPENGAQLPTRILVIHGDDADRENDIVVAMNDAGEVQVEGGARHPPIVDRPNHDRFALGFGRAVILAGNDTGHGVLVRPLDDNELSVLE